MDYKLLLKKFISNVHEDLNVEAVLPMKSSLYEITEKDNQEIVNLIKEISKEYLEEDEDDLQTNIFD